ncbi:hypothetical protein L3X39_10380 [Sabulilitoribacter multivorans]|uniref:Uncharacterized protein n=1 Tax=Flaviramulus multivorans TaxID=1304750 RepID=A0ABS9IKD5_9FLAO|nr:hypothetical protein [Flaviramulus multivorans]MCF7561041.1 hypothetical protein [Flaviramulus multivorans]
MKLKINLKTTLFTFFLAFTFFGCKKENTFTDYKYADKPDVLNCETIDSELYKEALYAFEDDILNFYKKTNPNESLLQSYNKFIRTAIYGSLNYQDIISSHTAKVFEALKNEADLWDAGNTKSHLNYNSKILNCVSNNIQDTALKTTFNALISTNSMSPKLFGSPLMPKYRNALNDKYLATYIALDLFYAKLFDIDISQIDFDKPEPTLDFNVIPQKSNTNSN